MLRSFTRLTRCPDNHCMRSLLSLPFAAALLVLPVLAQHPAPPPGTADQYPAFERHAADHLSIAADPYDTPEEASIFRVDYTSANIIPIRIIITNEGDTPTRSTMRASTSLPPPETKFPPPDRAMPSEPSTAPPILATKIPIGPIKIGGKGKNQDKKIEQDFSEFQYSAIAVEPHTTRAGFLFYDLQDLESPLYTARISSCAVSRAPTAESSSPSRFPSTNIWPARPFLNSNGV